MELGVAANRGLLTFGVAFAAALSTLCFMLAVVHLAASRHIGNRMARLGLRDDERLASDQAGRRVVGGRVALHQLGRGLARRSARDRLRWLRGELARAGVHDRLTAEQFIGLRLLSALAGAALGGAFVMALGPYALASAAMGGALGYLAPRLVLLRLIHRRRRAIGGVLAGAIDMLAVSLEAGLSFDGAASSLCERADNELVVELRRYLGDLGLGRSRREALLGLVERTQLESVRQFVVAVIQADELGTGLARTLRAQARAIRAARRVRAEEQARKAPVKLLFPLVLCIMPVLLMVIMGPALLEALALLRGQ
jgi:tight adherence protein C